MFVLNHDVRAPLYTQLYTQIKEHILSGKLAPDARLPSVRDLAAELSASRNTVENAYLELHAEGYIYSRPRSGYFVTPVRQDPALLSLSPRQRKRSPLPEVAARYQFDFHPARLDQDAFPAKLWRKCFLECLRQNSRELVLDGAPQGEPELRGNIQKYLEQSRGVACETEQIVICAGLQHSLDIVGHILKDRHPVVAVENPGYHLPRAVFGNHSFKTISIPVGADGMDLEVLEGSGSTVAYVTPSHQFPMGCVMPIANRLRLIEWAKADGKVIIEDDYDSEFRYHGKPIPSLQGLNPGGDIIYSGTFSKVLSPALRVSYLVLPHSLLSAYRRLFNGYFSSVSLLEQKTLAKFMEQGHWDRHVRRMRTLYQKKHDTLLRAVERHFGEKAVIVGQGAGLHIILQLAGKFDEKELISRAEERGIRLFPFSVTCASGIPHSSNFLLGFGGLPMSRIDQGVALLFESWFR